MVSYAFFDPAGAESVEMLEFEKYCVFRSKVLRMHFFGGRPAGRPAGRPGRRRPLFGPAKLHKGGILLFLVIPPGA